MSELSAPPSVPGPIPQAPPAPRTSKAAIWAMITGILGVTWLPAIILGCVGLSNIKKSNNTLGGSGFAISGIVLGGIWLLLTIPILGILASVATPAYNSVRQSGLLTKNMSNAKVIVLGCKIYAEDHDGNFPATLDDLHPDYIDLKETFNFEDGSPEQTKFIYYPGYKTSDPRKPILASPQPLRKKRIVGYSDGSVQQTAELVFENFGPL